MTHLLLLSLLVLPLATASTAQQPGRRPRAISDLENVDQDFTIQGEYVSTGGGACSSLGLQVVAMGSGSFDARLLMGGLPGAGWDRSSSQPLEGSRGEQYTVLRSRHGLQVIIQDGFAFVYDDRGRVVGRLRRVNRTSPTMGARPPDGALVLVGDAGVAHLEDAQLTEEGWLEVGARTAMPIGDSRIHLEFRTPYMPQARGQRRGNSGVYLQRRYEVQILDSFGLQSQANECGALYRQRPPAVNMCLPPLTWQSYDIYFRAPRWDGWGNKLINARLTLIHNGVIVHDDVEITSKTGNGRAEAPQPLPILLQDHGNPVVFRNFWILPLVSAPPACSAQPTRIFRLGHGCCGLRLLRR